MSFPGSTVLWPLGNQPFINQPLAEIKIKTPKKYFTSGPIVNPMAFVGQPDTARLFNPYTGKVSPSISLNNSNAFGYAPSYGANLEPETSYNYTNDDFRVKLTGPRTNVILTKRLLDAYFDGTEINGESRLMGDSDRTYDNNNNGEVDRETYFKNYPMTFAELEKHMRNNR